VFLPILIQISDDIISTEARQEGRSTQDMFRKTMTPWTFDIKFPLDTQFTFGSLTFAMGEDRDLKMLPPRASARASCSGSFIYIGRCLFRFESFCRVINSQRQARSGYSDRDVHHSAIHRSIEFVFISLVPRSRFI
jgi:hypothetical protein